MAEPSVQTLPTDTTSHMDVSDVTQSDQQPAVMVQEGEQQAGVEKVGEKPSENVDAVSCPFQISFFNFFLPIKFVHIIQTDVHTSIPLHFNFIYTVIFSIITYRFSVLYVYCFPLSYLFSSDVLFIFICC